MAANMGDDLNLLDRVYGDSNDFDDLFGDDSLENMDTSYNAPSGLTDPYDTQLEAQTENQDQEPMDMAVDEEAENFELNDLLAEGDVGEGGLDMNSLLNRELETGEKDADAVDYGDISDDDELPEEDEPTGGPVQGPDTSFLDGIQESAALSDDMDDDLFGDDGDLDVSFQQPTRKHVSTSNDLVQHKDDVASVSSDNGPASVNFQAGLETLDEGMTEEEQRSYRLQLALLQGHRDEDTDAMGAEEMSLWLQMNYPAYNPDDDAPFWNRLLPPRDGAWSPAKNAKPPKKPRPIRPTKLTLDIEPDQSVLFTSPAMLVAPTESRADLIYIHSVEDTKKLDSLDGSESDDELPNGYTNLDFDFICTEFDTLSHAEDEDESFEEPRTPDSDVEMFNSADDFETSERPTKRRRTGMNARDLVAIHQYDLPSFDNPEKLTARIAAEVVLDLNDAKLLVEEIDPDLLKQRIKPGEITIQSRSLKERLTRRFKTSNDASYNLLQQNQKKVRGQLTNMTIDHSVPAVRLQYPYYQVNLSQKEKRNWHRKQMVFKNGIAFSRVNKQKRKDYKSKPVREAFTKTRDLSMADNSYTLLLEYSEEHPVMLSQTGMGNKVVNYYRKIDSNDVTRPKADIGDTSVLMPEDKSPFNNFGHIDPGESTLALYNTMYRAPIFKQDENPQDFLIVREVTGINGQLHYLRNIDYRYTVGQELPTVQVPGTHSRMVTTVSKNRLKAIAFRIARRKKSHRIYVGEVTRHFPETNDMQNRQKMKEFMAYNKDHKEWEMKHNEPIPDEDEIQKSLTPEEICLLESMQVGAQYLQDSGYAEDDGEKSDDEDKEGQKELSIEQQLAPWKTTKNFIQATQGKAMLKLYGEGDPSGRGEAFSFIKTSMKGGFKAQGLSANENVAGQRGSDATGGHTYNVARQQKLYDDSIRNVWIKQKQVLSSQVEPDDIDDEGVDGQMDDVSRSRNVRATPASGAQTPSARRRDDETGTSFSKRSVASQGQHFLRIQRKIWDAESGGFEWKEVIESDQQVIKSYMKRREQIDRNTILTSGPTGDEEVDARRRQTIEEELQRLEAGTVKKKRRSKKKILQEAAAAAAEAGSPDANGLDPAMLAATSGGRQTQATQRKCANCGMVGHIKTNKKLCPMLNGQQQPDTGGALDGSSFMSAHPSM